MSQQIERLLEGIQIELVGDEPDPSQIDRKSIKALLSEINFRARECIGLRKREYERHRYELSWALGFIGVVGVLLAVSQTADGDIAWMREHTIAFRLWGVALCTVFVGVSLERSSLVKALWGFTITKIIVSIIFSGLIIYARGRAAGYMNEVFHIDASAIPITLVFSTGLIVFKLLVPFVFAVAIALFCAHFIIAVNWIKDKRAGVERDFFPWHSLLSISVASVILFYGWHWARDQLSDERVPEKIYLMAHALDFNRVHECANVDPTRPVIFLGASQESVLVAPYGLEDFDFATFFEARVTVPTDFTRERCVYKEPEREAPDELLAP